MSEFLLMFGSQLCAYLLITLNYRAVAHASYVGTAASDLIFVAFNFGFIQRIAKANSTSAWVGYTLGGVVGSLLGIFVSTRLKGF